MAAKLSLGSGIALVTGAANGIGRESAFAFAEAGAKGVIFADIDEQGVKQAAEESKKHAKHAEYRAVPAKLDISDVESVQSLVALAIKEFGRIDYAVNSAGIDLDNYGAFTPNFDVDRFMKATEVNINGAAFFVRAVTAAMAQQEPLTYDGIGRDGTRSLGRGSIILLGSVSSFVGVPGMASYTTSKHAILGIMRSAAVDALTLKAGIRVNAVCPSWTDTPMVQNAIKTNPTLGHMIQGLTPLNRAAAPEEVADSIIFLSSPFASYINGTTLTIDSGMTLPYVPMPLPS